MKEVFENGKGYGNYSEDFKKDSKESDFIISKAFKDLVEKGYQPSEICLEFIQSITCHFAMYSIQQGIEDRKLEKEQKK